MYILLGVMGLFVCIKSHGMMELSQLYQQLDRLSHIGRTQTETTWEFTRTFSNVLHKSAHVSPDNKQLVTISDNVASIWNINTGSLVCTLTAPSNILSAQFSPDGKSIATTSQDINEIRIWNATNAALIKTLQYALAFTLPVFNSIEFSADGQRILTIDYGTALNVWDIKTGKSININSISFTRDLGSFISAHFSPNGKLLLAAHRNIAKIWDPSNGKDLKTFSGHTAFITSAQFSPDEKLIVTASYDQTAKIWDVMSGKEFKTLSGHTGNVTDARFSPNGKLVVTASGRNEIESDKTAKIWDTNTGDLKATLPHTFAVLSAQFSPDGTQILTTEASWTNSTTKTKIKAYIWDAQTGTLVQTLEGHTNTIISAEFSPDGKYIVTVSADKTARVYQRKSR